MKHGGPRMLLVVVLVVPLVLPRQTCSRMLVLAALSAVWVANGCGLSMSRCCAAQGPGWQLVGVALTY